MKFTAWLLVAALALAACSDTEEPTTPAAALPEATSTAPGAVETPVPATSAPTPGPACCITTVTVTWPTDTDESQAQVPQTWDFEASAPCGTIANPVIEINSGESGQSQATISSSDAFGCDMTVTWQSIDGWAVEGGSSQTPIDSSASAGEFRSIDFVMIPAP